MRIAVAGSTGLIGSQLTALARKEGHEVVEISLETGFDLLAPRPGQLEQALAGADAVVDVTQSPSLDEAEATDFFTTVATNLGRSATAAAVTRSVVLTIVGAEQSLDYGYYVAKTRQVEATRRSAPAPLVLHATQFHEFAGQMLRWNREGDVTRIIDVPTQPVDTAEIVRLLLDLATGAVTHDVELAGPKVERLVDQVRTLVSRSGEAVTVEAVPGPASMAGGSMLPGPDAVIRGVDWTTWLGARPTPA
jgi:uncharacterized protein YbjT (DUF2867 family)